jgi:hypothetical protein
VTPNVEHIHHDQRGRTSTRGLRLELRNRISRRGRGTNRDQRMVFQRFLLRRPDVTRAVDSPELPTGNAPAVGECHPILQVSGGGPDRFGRPRFAPSPKLQLLESVKNRQPTLTSLTKFPRDRNAAPLIQRSKTSARCNRDRFSPWALRLGACDRGSLGRLPVTFPLTSPDSPQSPNTRICRESYPYPFVQNRRQARAKPVQTRRTAANVQSMATVCPRKPNSSPV